MQDDISVMQREAIGERIIKETEPKMPDSTTLPEPDYIILITVNRTPV